MIRVIFLDIDNTLLDFEGYVKDCMRAGFDHFGIGPCTDEMIEIFHRENLALWKALERGELSFEELVKIRWNTAFKAMGISFDGPTFENYFRAYLNESAIPVEGANELLEALYPNYLLFTASNGTRNQQTHRLKLAGMDRYFKGFCLSETLGASKPSQEFFEGAFAKARELLPDLKPEECVMLGDSLTADMAGGRNFGMKTLLFDRGGAHRGAYPDTVDLAAETLAEMPARIRTL